MEGWIIYSKYEGEVHEESSVWKILIEAKTQGITMKIFTPEQFDIIVTKDDRKSIRIDGEVQHLPDFILPRMGSGTTYFALAVIRHFERLGVPVINGSEAIETVKDKLYSIQVLAENNLPVPKTMLAKFPINAELIEKQIWFPVIVKTLSGSQWSWVFLSENRKNFENTMDMIEKVGQGKNLIFQEFIEQSSGKDLRVFVVGGKVIGCMKRTGQEGDFRANYSRWGSIEMFETTPEIEWIAVQCAHLLWLDIAGVDLLFDGDHFKVCEVNSSPWLKGIEQATEKNIAKEILDYVRFRLGKFD